MVPKVSVQIITKDRAALLARALESVRQQQGVEWEVVVVDDGSTDATPAFLREAASQDSRIRVVTHPFSRGRSQSRQHALEQTQAGLVALLDDDDTWLDPHKLQKQVALFDTRPQLVLGGTWMEGTSDPEPTVPPIMRRPESDTAIRGTMLFQNNFFTSTVMFSRAAAETVGGFVVRGPDLAEDYDLWLRLGTQGTMYNMNEVLTRYRLPSYSAARRRKFLSKQLELVRSHAGDYPWAHIATLLLKARLMVSKPNKN